METYDEARKECSEVATCAYGVGGDVRPELTWKNQTLKQNVPRSMKSKYLGNNERSGDEPHPKPRRMARVPIEELSKQVNGRPNDLAIDSLRG